MPDDTSAQGATAPKADSADQPVIVLDESDRRSIAITGIFLLLSLHAIYFASAILIPITLALLLSMLFSPVVLAGQRIGLPAPAGAAVVVAGIIGLLLSVIYGLSGSAQEWLERVPQNFFRIEEIFAVLREPIEQIKDATDRVEAATQMVDQQPLEVRVERPGFTELFLTGTPQTLASIGVLVMLLYFLLASGDGFLRKAVAVMPALEGKKRIVEIIRSIQQDVSYYLVMLTLFNVLTGLAVAITCWAVGLDNPVLWGVVVTVLSFAPFAGAAVISLILLFVGLLSFSNLAFAVVPVSVYLVVMFAVTNIAVPYILGSRLTLSPLAIFISIIFWGWMWGVVGALLAVPILATIKIVCDRVDSLQPVSEFLAP
jgi:predicted PurR-regulated permease PerM